MYQQTRRPRGVLMGINNQAEQSQELPPLGAQAPAPFLQEQPVAQEMPKAPPSARSTDPWSKANIRRTLLDMGTAMLSDDNFFGAMGKAGQAVGNRMDQLQAEATPKRQYGVGPDGTFEAVTDPVTGETTFNRMPQFQDVLAEQRQLDRMDKQPVLTAEDHIEMRSRAMSAILALPESQRAAAYQQLLRDPTAFGGMDTTGMPEQYDPTYASTIGGMGMTAHQMQQMALREAEHQRRSEADRIRAQQAQQRIDKPPAARATTSKAPTGFIWD